MPVDRTLQHRQFARYALLHLLLFAGLYQIGFTPSEWARVEEHAKVSGQSSTAWVLKESGPWGLARAYFRTDSDERLYREYANLTLFGQADTRYIAAKQYAEHVAADAPRLWPYRNVRIEYPPLALLLGMIPPRLLSGDSYAGYRFALGVWLWCIQVVNLWLAVSLVRRDGGLLVDERHVLRGSLAFCLLLGNIVATRIDAFVTTVVLLVILRLKSMAARPEREAGRALAGTGFVIGLGVLTKIVPVLLLAPASYVAWARPAASRFSHLRALALGLVLTLGVIHILCAMLLGAGYLATYTYHAARGIQLESLYGSGLLVARWLGHDVQLDLSFGSSNLISSSTSALSSMAPALFLVGASLYAANVLYAGTSTPLRIATTILVLFIATNKVFSPQYLIWVALPILVLFTQEKNKWWLFLLLTMALLSQVLYPRAYGSLKAFSFPLVLVLVLRNGMLLALLISLWRTGRVLRGDLGSRSQRALGGVLTGS